MNNKVGFTRRIDNQTKWLFALIILPLYIYLSSMIGSAIIKLIFSVFSLKTDYYTLTCLLNFVVDLGMMIVVFFIFKDQMLSQWKDFKKNWSSHLFYGLIVGTALIYLAGICGGMLTLALGGAQTSENQALIEAIMDVQPILMMIPTVIFAPILEEMIFRGIIFGWAYELSPKIAHILSAFIFGFVHIMSAVMSGQISEWIQIFSYFFMGIALSFLYEKKNNIYVPILSHAVNNLISVLLILF